MHTCTEDEQHIIPTLLIWNTGSQTKYLLSPHVQITWSELYIPSIFGNYVHRYTSACKSKNLISQQSHDIPNLIAHSLVPRPRPLMRKRVWWLLSEFLVVLNQQSWFWTSQRNSATCKHVINICWKSILLNRHNQEIAQQWPDPFPCEKAGSGHKTRLHTAWHNLACRERGHRPWETDTDQGTRP